MTRTPTTKEIIEQENKYGAHNYHPLPVVLNKAEGVWVWDVEGKKYLDCLSSYSAVNQGHRHPRVLKSMAEQGDKLTLTSRAFHNDRLAPFLKKLCNVAGMEVALPMNTGAEAVETGIKIARKWGYVKKKVPEGAAEIIVCENNFHGRTTTIVGFSSDEETKKGFGPFTPGFKIIPYDDTEALEKAITPNTVAFLVEPIQGEAGVKVPSEGYLKKVKAICEKHNVLLMTDEIQTGLGRTGKMFCFEHDDIKPDILLVGKALGGGVYPVSAAISSWDIMEVIGPGEHGSTFGGNPLACAIASEAIDILVDEKLVEASRDLGGYFLEKLKKIASENPKVDEARGRGLLLAIDLTAEAGPAREYCKKMKEMGILAKDTHKKTIRFAPPLVITREDVDWACDIISKSLE